MKLCSEVVLFSYQANKNRADSNGNGVCREKSIVPRVERYRFLYLQVRSTPFRITVHKGKVKAMITP